MRIGLVVPHIFMQERLINDVIFSPGHLAINLANGLTNLSHEVFLFSPGKVTTQAKNINADLSLLEKELATRKYDLKTLMNKHPLTFITLSRQIQSEIISKAYKMADENELDIVHIYINEEELALTFSDLCNKSVLFTHHDPFSFLSRYRTLMPKYKDKNWISISYAQRKEMPLDTNWVGNIYHGITNHQPQSISNVVNKKVKGDCFAYFGRIVEQKGVHLAIEACKRAKVKLKIAGKHYNDEAKDSYWKRFIEPEIDNENIEYVGFLNNEKEKNKFLSNAKALIVPSIFNEPFGMVLIEALRVGTPIIGLNNGAIPEIIEDNKTGFVVKDERKVVGKNEKGMEVYDHSESINGIVNAIKNINRIDRNECIRNFKERFTLEKMVLEHEKVYANILNNSINSNDK